MIKWNVSKTFYWEIPRHSDFKEFLKDIHHVLKESEGNEELSEKTKKKERKNLLKTMYKVGERKEESVVQGKMYTIYTQCSWQWQDSEESRIKYIQKE